MRFSVVSLLLIEDVARSGHTGALLMLGDLLSAGAAGSVDAQGAISAYERAAALGSAEALLRLGDIYRDGILVPADGDRAVAYYLQAAEPVPAEEPDP